MHLLLRAKVAVSMSKA